MTPDEYTAWIITRLGYTDAHMVYDGHVPTAVPMFPGSTIIRPYIAVWTMPLREGPEQDLAHSHQHDTSDVTVTVAAASPDTVRPIAQTTIGLLHRQTLPSGGELRHREPHVPIQWDETVTPGRFFIPLAFRLHQP